MEDKFIKVQATWTALIDKLDIPEGKTAKDALKEELEDMIFHNMLSAEDFIYKEIK